MPCPIVLDLAKHTVFDGIPFRTPRRVVTQGDLDVMRDAELLM